MENNSKESSDSTSVTQRETTLPLIPQYLGDNKHNEDEQEVGKCRGRLKTEDINEMNVERRKEDIIEDNITERPWEKLTCDPGEEEEGRSSDGSSREVVAPVSYWPAALGSCIIMMMINMVGPCFAIIFSPLLLSLGTSSTAIAWIFNVKTLLWFMCGLFLGPLVEEYSWRRVAMAASLVYFFSVVASAFATSAWFLFFSFSIVGGSSYGLLNTLCFLVIPHYFTRWRGIANACMMAGVCLGQMVGPILIEFLQQKFGFFGATLVLAAVNFHCCVGASLFRPLRVQANTKTRKQTDDLAADATNVDNAENRKICKISDNVIIRVFRNTAATLSILKSPRAVIIGLGGTLTLNCWLNFLGLMPFAVQAAGHPIQRASLCMTVGAVTNLVARLTVSTMSDWPKFNMQACCMVSSAILTGAIVAFSLVQDNTWQMVIMGVWGCGVGGYMGVFNLVMVHYMGLDLMTSTMGASLLLVGLGFLTVGPSVGFIRDISNSYTVSMWVLAGMAACSFTLWIFMPAAVRHDRNKSYNTRPSEQP